jgi:RimJ/RimL family protein N-acetyltransferase
MIYGKRLRLRGVEKTDIPKFYEWINDPEVNEGLAVYLPMSMMDEQGWLERASQREQPEKPLAIEMRDRKDWRLIGNCGFFNIEWTHRAAEFGIMIGDKSVWNQGYGTEAVQLILQHGFETLNLNRIYLRVYSTNPRAKRVYEKAGFILEGTMREAVYKHGKYANVHFMGVLRSEWDARQEGR